MTSDDKACEDCMYAFFYYNTDKVGQCRAHPPTLYVRQEFTNTEFPAIERKEWCGEFKHREERLNQ